MKIMKHYILFVLVLIGHLSTSAQCISNTHSPFDDQGWLSCVASPSPNPERGTGHWLQYDLGHVYALDSMYIWNHNVWGETENGVREIIVDYSSDGINWESVGPYTIDKAPGSWKYNAPDGEWLGNALGRYFVIHVLETWDGSNDCAGFGEVKFTLNELVDVEEEVLATSWSISPNPVADLLTVHLPENSESAQISIINALGQQVHQSASQFGRGLRVNVEDFEDGMYYVRLQVGKEISTKSFVKVD